MEIWNDATAFKDIFMSTNEGILVSDLSGTILLANPRAENLFAFPPGTMVGKSIDDLVPPSHRKKHADLRGIYTLDPKPRVMGIGRDLYGMRRDGSLFPVEISLSHTKIEEREYVVSFIIDITRRKKAEENLKKSEEQLIHYANELEQRVEKRTKDLNLTILKLESTNKQLEEAEQETRQALSKEKELNELKSRFVSMASHEFRTPLSSILSSASLVEKYIETGALENTTRHLTRIKNSVKNLTDILNDFLSLGKLEEGKIEAYMQTFPLKEELVSIIQEMEPILKKGQRIFLEFEGNGEVTTDARLLRNILINLISNASKYSAEGKKIIVHSKLNEQLTISVLDEGIGIPEEELQHMFERFFRAKNAFNIQGTGLGLNIVKKYLELLHGKIEIQSKLNVGSTFTIHIPTQEIR